jgi:hypothetical protein
MKPVELQWICVAVLLLSFTTRIAAEETQPTERVLSEMGLSGLDIMTDAQALTVRGHGFMNGSSARVFGNSFATFDTPSGTSHSENGYAAERRHIAFGANFSVAGNRTISTGGENGSGAVLRGNAVRRGGLRWGGNTRLNGLHGGGNANVTTKVFAGGFSIAGAL